MNECFDNTVGERIGKYECGAEHESDAVDLAQTLSGALSQGLVWYTPSTYGPRRGSSQMAQSRSRTINGGWMYCFFLLFAKRAFNTIQYWFPRMHELTMECAFGPTGASLIALSGQRWLSKSDTPFSLERYEISSAVQISSAGYRHGRC